MQVSINFRTGHICLLPANYSKDKMDMHAEPTAKVRSFLELPLLVDTLKYFKHFKDEICILKLLSTGGELKIASLPLRNIHHCKHFIKRLIRTCSVDLLQLLKGHETTILNLTGNSSCIQFSNLVISHSQKGLLKRKLWFSSSSLDYLCAPLGVCCYERTCPLHLLSEQT